MKATVLVRPKDGILDPQGEAVGARCAARLRRSATRASAGVVDLEVDADDADGGARARSSGCARSCSRTR